MRLFVLLACLWSLACAGDPPAPADAPAEASVPAAASADPLPAAAPPAGPQGGDPPAAPGISPAALGAAGACKGEDERLGEIRPFSLGDGRTLLEVNCAMYAYQGVYEFWLAGPAGLKPASDTANGGPLKAVGLPEYDVASGALTWLSKSRGPGDCGDWYWYALQGDRLVLREHRSRECGEPPPEDEEIIPSEWPLVQ